MTLTKIFNFRASEWTAWRIHVLFGCIYLLLLIRAILFIYESNDDLLNQPLDTIWIFAIKRLAAEFYAPFRSVGLPMPWLQETSLPHTLILSLLIYGLLHRGMFLKTTNELTKSMTEKVSFTDKILQLCRAFFYVAGALLLLLILIRMCFMLYQDVTHNRSQIIISKPASSPVR